MNVSLTPELESYINNKVTSGMYTSASEVIRESLRLMYFQDDLRQEKIAHLNQAIDLGLQQLGRGEKISAKSSYEQLRNKIDSIANQDPNLKI